MSASMFCIVAGLVVMALFVLNIYHEIRDGRATIKGISADRERQPVAYAAVMGFDGLWVLAGFVLFLVGLML